MAKVKMKSNRSAAKRFRATGSGKVKREQAYHGHLFTDKSAKRKRNLRQSTLVSPADLPRVKKMLGS